MTCRTCGKDRMAPEPSERLAYIRYVGSAGEPSISFPVPCPGLAVVPFEEAIDNCTGVGSHRNEVVAMPNRRWMRVSIWAAVYLAGARQRHGPWVDVRLTPAGWGEVRARAPWLHTAADALRLMDPGFLQDFRECEVSRMKIRDVLLATGEAQATYRGGGFRNWFGVAVDLLDHAERTGEDPMRVVREILLSWHRALNEAANRDLERLNRTVEQSLIGRPLQ